MADCLMCSYFARKIARHRTQMQSADEEVCTFGESRIADTQYHWDKHLKDDECIITRAPY